MSDLLVLKFGGSLITDKQTLDTPRPQIIAQLAQEVAQFCTDNPDVRLLIGNGAGSFGHFRAHEYGLRDGAHNPKQWYGACATHSAVQRLNTLVVEALLGAQVPAFSLAPAALFFCEDGAITERNLHSLQHVLEQGCVPVVFGDMAADASRGGSIISTEKALDAIVPSLRDQFERIIMAYLMDKEGILDATGRRIPQLAASDDVHLHEQLGHDVTGGIVGKITAARAASRYADMVYVAKGDTPGVLQALLTGADVGTRILQ